MIVGKQLAVHIGEGKKRICRIDLFSLRNVARCEYTALELPEIRHFFV